METTNKAAFSSKKWILNSFAGWFAGILLILLFSSILEAMGIHHQQFYLGLGMGMGVCTMQWLQLRKHLSVSYWWVVSAAAGLGLPFVIFDLLPDGILGNYLPYAIAVGGLLAGLFQYLQMRTVARGAGRWVYGCWISWTAAVATVFLIDYTSRISIAVLLLAIINFALILAGGIIQGWISGLFMKRIVAANSTDRKGMV